MEKLLVSLISLTILEQVKYTHSVLTLDAEKSKRLQYKNTAYNSNQIKLLSQDIVNIFP